MITAAKVVLVLAFIAVWCLLAGAHVKLALLWKRSDKADQKDRAYGQTLVYGLALAVIFALLWYLGRRFPYQPGH